MLDKNIFSMSQYGKWFIEQYRFLQLYQRQNDAILRVVDIKYKPCTKEPILSIQLVGKNYFVEKPLNQLLSESNIIEAFSRKDVAVITKLKTEYDLAPKISVKAHFMKEGKASVVLEDRSGQSQTSTVSEIQKHKEMIGKLSSKDACLIGYLQGSESV